MGSRHSHLVIFPRHYPRLTGSNLLSVKNYGEFEFWLACAKSSLSWPLFSLVQSQLAVLPVCRSERDLKIVG